MKDSIKENILFLIVISIFTGVLIASAFLWSDWVMGSMGVMCFAYLCWATDGFFKALNNLPDGK